MLPMNSIVAYRSTQQYRLSLLLLSAQAASLISERPHPGRSRKVLLIAVRSRACGSGILMIMIRCAETAMPPTATLDGLISVTCLDT